MPKIEISIDDEDTEDFEHLAYCDSIDDAIAILYQLKEDYE